MNDNEQVFTLAELTKRWKCARKTILEAIHRGDIHAFRIGNRAYRVTRDEVVRYETHAEQAEGAA
jgi:excisionase family DNA binding protein